MKKEVINGVPVKIEVWDTGGQERFRTITKSYYERAMGVLLVYDCCDERSFLEIRNWIKQIEAHSSHPQVKLLVASKCDIEPKKIKASEGQNLAEEYKMEFFETSSKSGLNVVKAFQALAELSLNATKTESEAVKGSFALSPQTDEKKPKSGCCKS